MEGGLQNFDIQNKLIGPDFMGKMGISRLFKDVSSFILISFKSFF